MRRVKQSRDDLLTAQQSRAEAAAAHSTVRQSRAVNSDSDEHSDGSRGRRTTQRTTQRGGWRSAGATWRSDGHRDAAVDENRAALQTVLT